MKDPNLMSRQSSAYFWAMVIKHLVTEYVILLIRRSSEAEMWFEDQTMKDFHKDQKMDKQYPVNLDPEPSPVVHDDHGGEVPLDHDDEVQQEDQLPPEPQPRRSTREKQPSTRYSPNEYVMFTDAGEPEH